MILNALKIYAMLLTKSQSNMIIFAIIGDINYDDMKPDKCVHLMQFCNIFYVTNMVNNPECFPRSSDASRIDVVLMDQEKCLL